jgi:hypothetical protein
VKQGDHGQNPILQSYGDFSTNMAMIIPVPRQNSTLRGCGSSKLPRAIKTFLRGQRLFEFRHAFLVCWLMGVDPKPVNEIRTQVDSDRQRARRRGALGSVHKFDAPQEDVTTSSLEALKAYSLGRKARREKGPKEAIPFLARL